MGKLSRTVKKVANLRNRSTDFFVYYISGTRYGPTCGARYTLWQKMSSSLMFSNNRFHIYIYMVRWQEYHKTKRCWESLPVQIACDPYWPVQSIPTCLGMLFGAFPINFRIEFERFPAPKCVETFYTTLQLKFSFWTFSISDSPKSDFAPVGASVSASARCPPAAAPGAPRCSSRVAGVQTSALGVPECSRVVSVDWKCTQ